MKKYLYLKKKKYLQVTIFLFLYSLIFIINVRLMSSKYICFDDIKEEQTELHIKYR